jgi:hypothetical protein
VEYLRFGELKELNSDNLHARSRARLEARIFLAPDKPRHSHTYRTSIRGKEPREVKVYTLYIKSSTFIGGC